MSELISVQGPSGRIILRSLEYVRDSHCRDIGGAFLVNIKTKECMLLKSKRPYSYLAGVYRNYKLCKRTNTALMMRCAENIEDLYVLIPQTSTAKNFITYDDFPLEDYTPFKKAPHGSLEHSYHISNKESRVYKIRDSVSGFTYFTTHKPVRPKATISKRLRAMLEPHITDDLREQKLEVSRHINQILRSFISLGERNITSCVAVRQTIERKSQYLALDIEEQNRLHLTEWLNQLKNKHPSQLIVS